VLFLFLIFYEFIDFSIIPFLIQAKNMGIILEKTGISRSPKGSKKRGENLVFSVRLSCLGHQGCPSPAKGLVQADQVGCNGPVTLGKLILKGK
jgi:hypothetical protein